MHTDPSPDAVTPQDHERARAIVSRLRISWQPGSHAKAERIIAIALARYTGVLEGTHDHLAMILDNWTPTDSEELRARLQNEFDLIAAALGEAPMLDPTTADHRAAPLIPYTDEDVARLREWAATQPGNPLANLIVVVLDGLTAALAGQRERLAQLHDSIDPHCDHEKPGEGAGAMGAIIRYRDAIRRGDV